MSHSQRYFTCRTSDWSNRTLVPFCAVLLQCQTFPRFDYTRASVLETSIILIRVTARVPTNTVSSGCEQRCILQRLISVSPTKCRHAPKKCIAQIRFPRGSWGKKLSHPNTIGDGYIYFADASMWMAVIGSAGRRCDTAKRHILSSLTLRHVRRRRVLPDNSIHELVWIEERVCSWCEE